MRTPNEQLDGLDSDLAAAGQMIESLRQQVTLLRNTIEDASQIIMFEGAHYYLLGLEARDDALDATKDGMKP